MDEAVRTRWAETWPTYRELGPEAKAIVDGRVEEMVGRGWTARNARAWVMRRTRRYRSTGGPGTGH